MKPEGMRACNFFEHSSCIAKTANDDWDDAGSEADSDAASDAANRCLPACQQTSIQQDNVQYTHLGQGIKDYFTKNGKYQFGVDLADPNNPLARVFNLKFSFYSKTGVYG